MNNPAVRPMHQHIRPSHVGQQQLDAFLASLPTNLLSPPPDDFAAQLEWQSWQTHIRELREELAASLQSEGA